MASQPTVSGSLNSVNVGVFDRLPRMLAKSGATCVRRLCPPDCVQFESPSGDCKLVTHAHKTMDQLGVRVKIDWRAPWRSLQIKQTKEKAVIATCCALPEQASASNEFDSINIAALSVAYF